MHCFPDWTMPRSYFSEGDDWQQISYALSGEFVKDAQVVLEACPVDWRQMELSLGTS